VQSCAGVREYGPHDWELIKGRADDEHRSYSSPITLKMSKEDYIEKMEGQIEVLLAKKALASTSKTSSQSQSQMCDGYNSEE